jgi:predicted nucleotide-binding protein
MHLIKSGSPLNNLDREILPSLSETETLQLIGSGFPDSLSTLLQSRLYTLTGGHPWILQGVLEQLWDERDALDEASIDGAVRRFVRNRDDVFVSWIKAFGDAGQAAYRALSHAAGNALPRKSIKAVLPTGATVDATLQVLIYHGVIDESDAQQARVSGSMFRDWFLQNIDYVPAADVRQAGSPSSATSEMPQDERRRRVFIVYGRDRKLYSEVCLFLRALKLEPLEWNTIVEATQRGTPTIIQILEQGFAMAQAAVVLLTPDDEARLRPHFHQEDEPEYEKNLTPQPRPNVLFEAGLALAKFPNSTILVRFDKRTRLFSDIAGVHLVDLRNDIETRAHFARRLESCGLSVDQGTTGWQSLGDFTAAT